MVVKTAQVQQYFACYSSHHADAQAGGGGRNNFNEINP